MDQPFVLGVNYWPRRKAMYWWSDFDAGEVREEFAIIASLGMTIVRLFLLWDDWQPSPDMVSTECLKNLTTVLDIAAEHGLKIDLTFFTGHMSGPNWSPRWLLDANAPFPSRHVRQALSRIIPVFGCGIWVTNQTYLHGLNQQRRGGNGCAR
jgi:endo-1,4-beta-mannosidase